MNADPGVKDLAFGVFTNLLVLEVADIAGALEESFCFRGDIREDRNAVPVFRMFGVMPSLLRWGHRRIEFRQWRAIPARDITVLGVVALDQDALAGPAANQRRLRTVGRHIAATGADERDHRVDGAGAAKPLLAFLETLIHAVGVEPLFGFDADRVMVWSHWGSPSVRSEVAPTPRPGAHAARRGEGWLFWKRLQLGLQVEGCIILVGASRWPPDFLQSCEQLARFQDFEAFFAEPDEPEARAVGLSIGRCRARPEVVAIPEIPLRLELLVLLAPADLIGHISGLLRERDALEGSSSACAWQAELSAYSFGW